ncbi:uncharacterized protein F4822DRAFT_427944 [Hypoxylon trugodes]|uniref:uncharacterized protein n=1 Tax=Hypoxylon trugodes TaxID=326681 RepID=UPI0021908538|nr:uncharacterized protein F4822DRAFT_427944 [Hypoxylon trugodes]KAI1389599.1 hypothetical protein F4822DRAFT_427944 [Hypoxylon trugodes]
MEEPTIEQLRRLKSRQISLGFESVLQFEQALLRFEQWETYRLTDGITHAILDEGEAIIREANTLYDRSEELVAGMDARPDNMGQYANLSDRDIGGAWANMVVDEAIAQQHLNVAEDKLTRYEEALDDYRLQVPAEDDEEEEEVGQKRKRPSSSESDEFVSPRRDGNPGPFHEDYTLLQVGEGFARRFPRVKPPLKPEEIPAFRAKKQAQEEQMRIALEGKQKRAQEERERKKRKLGNNLEQEEEEEEEEWESYDSNDSNNDEVANEDGDEDNNNTDDNTDDNTGGNDEGSGKEGNENQDDKDKVEGENVGGTRGENKEENKEENKDESKEDKEETKDKESNEGKEASDKSADKRDEGGNKDDNNGGEK